MTAVASGLGPEMELTTLAEAVNASHRLPRGPFVSFNVSPWLVVEHCDKLARCCTASSTPSCSSSPSTSP